MPNNETPTTAASIGNLDAPAGAVFAVDTERRVIRGVAVPYGVVAYKGGQGWSFSAGTLDWADDPSRVKLWVNHDKAAAVGVAFELADTDAALVAAFKVARGADGDKALTMAEDGVWDSLSIGLHPEAKFRRDKAGVLHSVNVPLREISLTPAPVFGGARVTSVNFGAQQEEKAMPDAPPTVTVTAPDTGPPDTGPPAVFDTAPMVAAIGAGFSDLRGALAADAGRPEVVRAGGLEVTEPSPYRFDGTAGAESFSEDLRSYNADPAARQRLETFMDEVWETFAVTTGNTTQLSPTQNRPDLFVPNLTFTRPLWNLITTGNLTDKTPFTVPKFASAAGLVGPHTEGVEPTPGSFTATSQTITPSAVSGKVEITREVWDQGGSPQADQIIWGEMLNGYFEALEAKVAAMLNALSLTEINLGSGVDAALVNAVTNVFVDLQFVRGGNRYSALALDGLLFKALINAADGQGRKLLPVVGPTNAQGQTTGTFSTVNIGAQAGAAVWALGSVNSSNSYLFVPSSVYGWASAPKRFVFEYRVSAIDLAIWGYTGAACTRDSDVKRLDYTTLDTP